MLSPLITIFVGHRLVKSLAQCTLVLMNDAFCLARMDRLSIFSQAFAESFYATPFWWRV